MRSRKLILLALVIASASMSASSQNILMNILTRNSGIVSKGKIVFLEVTVCNTDETDSVPVYKLKPQISIPDGIAHIPPTGHTLPDGWTIISNNGSTIRLSNGTDRIPAHGCRTILIAMEGKAIGGPSTVSANLLFSNGESPGAISGGPTRGDNPADNSSTSTCTIIR